MGKLSISSKQKSPESKNIKQEVLLQIPGCTVHLMDKGEAIELAKGELMVVQILDKQVPIATVIKVGNDLLWPLTRDEPVVKLDFLHYLFSLPMKDSNTLSYGVTFLGQYINSLASLDSFLRDHSCFTDTTNKNKNIVEWNQFTSRIDGYNNFLAKAIIAGTGQIIKGIFICSNAYSNQIHNGAEMFSNRPIEEKNIVPIIRTNSSNRNVEATNGSNINESLKRARNLSQMTENLSRVVLDGVGAVTGSIMAPFVKSFIATAPGEVLLASLAAVSTILEATEVAAKQALSATSSATTKIVSNKFGESAGEVTKDALATAGNCANTAWNVSKIRKAINPASSVSSGIARNAKK